MKLTKEEYGRAVGFVEWLAWSNRNDMENLDRDFTDSAVKVSAKRTLELQYKAIETLLYILYNMDKEVD